MFFSCALEIQVCCKVHESIHVASERTAAGRRRIEKATPLCGDEPPRHLQCPGRGLFAVSGGRVRVLSCAWSAPGCASAGSHPRGNPAPPSEAPTPSLKRRGEGSLLRVSHHCHHRLTCLRRMAVFPQIDSLPGAELKLAVCDGNGQAVGSEDRACM